MLMGCAFELMMCGVLRFVRDENELPQFAVMKEAHQDYVIAETYKNLPWLK